MRPVNPSTPRFATGRRNSLRGGALLEGKAAAESFLVAVEEIERFLGPLPAVEPGAGIEVDEPGTLHGRTGLFDARRPLRDDPRGSGFVGRRRELRELSARLLGQAPHERQSLSSLREGEDPPWSAHRLFIPGLLRRLPRPAAARMVASSATSEIEPVPGIPGRRYRKSIRPPAGTTTARNAESASRIGARRASTRATSASRRRRGCGLNKDQ